MLGLKDLFPNPGPKQNPNVAPYFEAPPQKIVAVEHPFIVKDVDKALKSFGQNPNLQRLFNDDSGRISLPLWFRPGVPTTKPIMSHNAASNNVVLKITVPKRTGRKRKRGSDDPFSGDVVPSEAGTTNRVRSVNRQDDPNLVLRMLKDNIGKYDAEAVGFVKDTHRYRGLADFQFSATQLPYLTQVADHLLPLDVSKLKEFKFDPSLRTGKGQEIIPPPYFTDRTIPFNYFYEQNPYVREQGKDEHGKPIVVNVQSGLAQTYGHYIDHDQYPVPAGPTKTVANSRQVPKDLLDRTRAALDERPIWTRRALIQRVAPYYSDNSLKIAIQLVGYQFKGGPFRDAVIRYGVDPRTDPSYRVYQTLAFKLDSLPVDSTVKNGVVRRMGREEARRSHLWDGTSYCTNGKFWQICDIRDPALLGLIEAAPLRDTCDIVADGWYYAGTWSKIKAFMKAKMIAIQADRLGSETDDIDDNRSNSSDKDNNAGNDDSEAGEDGATPSRGRKTRRKPGYIYDSVLLEKLAQWKDIPPDADKRYMVNVISLLYGLEDVAGLEGLRYRYRPRADFRDPLTAMGFGSKRPRRRRPLPGLADSVDAAAESSSATGTRAKAKRPSARHPGDDGLGGDRGSSPSSSSPSSDEDERDGTRRSGSDDEEDGEREGGMSSQQYPDDAWAHILDSDLDSSSEQADEDENDEDDAIDDEGEDDDNENDTMTMDPEAEAEPGSVGSGEAAGQGAAEVDGEKGVEQQDVYMRNGND